MTRMKTSTAPTSAERYTASDYRGALEHFLASNRLVPNRNVVFDIDVTGNRPDALSILGVARDVSILYGLPLTVPDPRMASGDTPALAPASRSASSAGMVVRF